MVEENLNKKYIKITQSNFLRGNSSRSGNSYLRSLEAYLVKNNRQYNIEGETYFIYVNDREDAMSLGFYFNFAEIIFFDGQKLLHISLVKKQEKKQRKIVINNSAGEKITMKKLKEQQYEEVKKYCLEKKEIIKRGILTKKEIEKAIKENKLNILNVNKKEYIDKQELMGVLRR